MNKFQIILILSAIALISVWLAVFYSIATLKHEPVELLNEINSEAKGGDASSMTNEIPNAFVDHETGHIIKSNLNLPKRYEFQEEVNSPPTLNEVRGNLTNYLTILHNRFVEIAGPRVNPYDIWDTYLDVTTNTVIKWDDYNRKSGRYHRTRKDGSIFVSISTYRDHLCPMTVKSLFDKASNPRNVNVAIFQQNCFEKKCRTGVLVGGKVEDTSTDINCYDDFCASPEGIASNACNTGQIRLFNVNESESLGPYMARYLSAKFYMGEQYYLQIDSHSEFVQNWDEKLIKMVNDAPAKRPIISAYPPDSKQKWQNTPGFRMCDSTIAEAQIEWHIVRLEASLPPSSVPPVPEYAPFVAAGFLFGGAGMFISITIYIYIYNCVIKHLIYM